MRLDKFLKVSRLIKRRPVANAVCSQGRVFINGNTAKASSIVKENDTIAIEYANKTVIVKVLKVPEGSVSIQESKDLYEILEQKLYSESEQ